MYYRLEIYRSQVTNKCVSKTAYMTHLCDLRQTAPVGQLWELSSVQI